MMKRTTFQVLIVAVGLAMLVSVGCNTVTPRKVRGDMSPALSTADSTRGQSANDTAREVDHTTRNVWNDIKRAMLLDDPSRLHPYPIP